MGQDSNEVFFRDPVLVSGAQILPRLISVTETLAAFDVSGVKEIMSAFAVHDYLTTSLAGANNDLTFVAVVAGAQSVTVTYVDPGGVTSAFSVSVTGGDITVNLARAASAITTTAAQALAGIQASVPASALVNVFLASGNNGAGIVTAMAQTSLAGPAGTTPTLDAKLQTSIDNVQWCDINAQFSQKTTVATAELGVFANLAVWCRWVLTLGGTSPEFAISLSSLSKR